MYVAVNNYYLVFLHSCIRLIYLSTLWKYYLCYRQVYEMFTVTSASSKAYATVEQLETKIQIYPISDMYFTLEVITFHFLTSA